MNSSVTMNNLEKLQCELEKAELESPDGTLSSQRYSQLLAIYLYQNELCYAKYLWKRIPANIKNNCTDLQKIWSVAQTMWLRDWYGTHVELNVEWDSTVVAEIMNALKERIRERALVLIGDAYSSLDLNSLAKMIGLTAEEALQISLEKGWIVNGTMVNPHKISKPQLSPTEEITEEQLYKLTQFVSFLEN